MLHNYIKLAWRSLRRQFGYTCINLLGLALGLACFLLASLYILHEFSFDDYHPEVDRLHRVVAYSGFGEKQWVGGTPGDPVPEMRTSYPDVEEVTRFRGCGADRIQLEGQWHLDLTMKCAESSLFDIFGFNLRRGDPNTLLDRPHTAVITASLSERLFGNADPIGQGLPIQLYDSLAVFEITGLMDDVPKNTHFTADLFLSRESLVGTRICLHCGGASIYARLKEGANQEAITSQLLTLVSEVQGKEYVEDIAFESVSAIHFSEIQAEKQGDRRYVYLLSTIALVILLIACANYMNLGTARAIRRTREVGLRKVVGASRSQIIRQFLVEALILTLLALPLALLLMLLSISSFNTLAETDISLLGQAGWKLMTIVLLVVVASGVVAGSYPALFLSKFNPISVLQGRLRAGRQKLNLRKALVVFQFTATIALLAGTLIIQNQLEFMQTKKLGFESDQVVIVPVRDRELMMNIGPMKQVFSNVAGVSSVTTGSAIPGQQRFSGMRFVDHPFGKEEAAVTFVTPLIDADFLETLEIPLLAGRNVSDTEPDFKNLEVLVNMAAVSDMRWESAEAALGELIGSNRRVVGVVPDFHFGSLHSEIEPLILGQNWQKASTTIAVKLAGGSIPATIDALERAWKNVGVNMPFEYQFLDEEIATLYEQEQRAGRVFGLFSGLAVLIACMGLFGLAAFSTVQRTKEIGIRRVLGATGAHIVRLLSADFLKLILISSLVAVPIAYFVADRWLEAFAFRVDIAALPFMVAGLVALVATIGITGFQALRSTYLNPIDSLRHE